MDKAKTRVSSMHFKDLDGSVVGFDATTVKDYLDSQKDGPVEPMYQRISLKEAIERGLVE